MAPIVHHPKNSTPDAYLATIDPRHTLAIQGTDGRAMTARVLFHGDPYGLEGCMTWGKDAGNGATDPKARAAIKEQYGNMPGIEFYDASQDKTKFGPLGQFTGGRYYLETILEGSQGLVPHGGVKEWNIDASEMARVRAWAKTFVGTLPDENPTRVLPEASRASGSFDALASMQPLVVDPLAGLREKVGALERGEKLVFDDEAMNLIAETEDEAISALANQIVSVANPARLGVKDVWLCWIPSEQEQALTPENREAVISALRGERMVYLFPDLIVTRKGFEDGEAPIRGYSVGTTPEKLVMEDVASMGGRTHLIVQSGFKGYSAAIAWIRATGLMWDSKDDYCDTGRGVFTQRELEGAFKRHQKGHWKGPQKGEVEGNNEASLLAAAFEHFHGAAAMIEHHGGTNTYTVSSTGYACD